VVCASTTEPARESRMCFAESTTVACKSLVGRRKPHGEERAEERAISNRTTTCSIAKIMSIEKTRHEGKNYRSVDGR
jgi:hypothetical protein